MHVNKTLYPLNMAYKPMFVLNTSFEIIEENLYFKYVFGYDDTKKHALLQDVIDKTDIEKFKKSVQDTIDIGYNVIDLIMYNTVLYGNRLYKTMLVTENYFGETIINAQMLDPIHVNLNTNSKLLKFISKYYQLNPNNSLILINSKGVIVYRANICDCLKKETEIIGKTFDKLAPEKYQKSYKKRLQHYINYGTISAYTDKIVLEHNCAAQNKTYYYEAGFHYINIDDSRYTMVLLKNITQKFIYHKEFLKLNEQKDMAFSVISHELRNLLHPIIGFSDLCTRYKDRSNIQEQESYLNHLNKSVNNMSDMLIQLLNWGKAISDNFYYYIEEFDIKKLINTEIGNLQPKIQQKQIVVEQNIEITRLKSSKFFWEIIIQNILTNAIKYAKINSNSCIKIYARQVNKYYVFEFFDNGIGIPQELMPQILNIAKEKKRNGTMEEVGTGLGLNTCKHLLKKMNGNMHIKSKENIGTAVTVYLPIFVYPS